MIGGLALSDLVGALHGLPPGPTALVVVVVLGLPKILKVAPKFLSALNERRVTKAIRSEAGEIVNVLALPIAVLGLLAAVGSVWLGPDEP